MRLLVHLLEVAANCSESDATVSLRVLLRNLLMPRLHGLALALEGLHLRLEIIDGLLLGSLRCLRLLALPGGLRNLSPKTGDAVLYGWLPGLAALEERQGGEACDLLCDLVPFELNVLQGVFEVVGSLCTRMNFEVPLPKVLAVPRQVPNLLLLLLHCVLRVVEGNLLFMLAALQLCDPSRDLLKLSLLRFQSSLEATVTFASLSLLETVSLRRQVHDLLLA